MSQYRYLRFIGYEKSHICVLGEDGVMYANSETLARSANTTLEILTWEEDKGRNANISQWLRYLINGLLIKDSIAMLVTRAKGDGSPEGVHIDDVPIYIAQGWRFIPKHEVTNS